MFGVFLLESETSAACIGVGNMRKYNTLFRSQFVEINFVSISSTTTLVGHTHAKRLLAVDHTKVPIDALDGELSRL